MTEKPVSLIDRFPKVPTGKKAKAALVAFLVALVCGVLRQFKIDIPYEIVWGGLAPLCLYIIGQGVADYGKSAALARVQDAEAAAAALAAEVRDITERLRASEQLRHSTGEAYQRVIEDLRRQLAAIPPPKPPKPPKPKARS